jgi:hypothetical protein
MAGGPAHIIVDRVRVVTYIEFLTDGRKHFFHRVPQIPNKLKCTSVYKCFKQNAGVGILFLSNTEPVIRKLSTILNTVVLHGTVDAVCFHNNFGDILSMTHDSQKYYI